MTTHHDTDLERVLADWLAGGPARAPEPTIRAAIDHARAHPRRRDAFAAVRADPMPPASRSQATWPGLVPASVIVALFTLAIVAGVAFVSGRPDGDGPAAPPTASPSPSALSPSTSPAPSPSPAKSPVATAVGSPVARLVTLETGTTALMTVRVTDRSGILVDAKSGLADGGGTVDPDRLLIQNVDDRTLRLTWTDAVCSIDYDLEIDGAAETFVLTPTCTDGDTVAQDRVLLLNFSVPRDAALLKGVIVPAP